MFKYVYPITPKDEGIEKVNKFIYLQLMKLGFRNTRDGTYHFKNIVITAFCEVGRELTYTQSIKLYSKNIDKNPDTIRSEISQTFCYLNQARYLSKFIDIFKYETDISLMTPSSLYESFGAFLQLQNFEQS